MTLIHWPDSLLPADGSPNLVPQSRGGGRSLGGLEQTVSTDAGYWSMTYSGIPLSTDARVQLFNALRVLIDGRAGSIILPMLEKRFAPWPVVDGKKVFSNPPVPFSDGSTFSDGSSFSQPVIFAYVAEAAALRATTLKIDMHLGSVNIAGVLFSIDNRTYRIGNIISTAGSVLEVKISPPLRVAVQADKFINFDRPVCQMKLASDREMDIDLKLGRWARPSPRFVEDI